MGSREPICEEEIYANGVNENQKRAGSHNDAAPERPDGYGIVGCLCGIVSSSCTWPFSGRRLPKAPPE